MPRTFALLTYAAVLCLLSADGLIAAERLQPTQAVKNLILPGESFLVEGRPSFILLPPEDKRQKPQPWIMYAPTLPAYPDSHEKWMHEQFLMAGVAVAGIDVGEAYGSPQGQKLMTALYAELTEKRGYATRPCLLGRSRGGLWVSSWAIANPDKVAGIAGIYPVFDLRTYPGLAKAASAYGATAQELESRLMEHNPIARVDVLAKARVPVCIIHGDVDTVVPLKENSAALADRYKLAGAADAVTLIVAEGQGHNFWEGFFRCQPLIDFAIKRAKAGIAPENVDRQSKPTQQANTWIKLSPLPEGPISPRLGYEGACVWDSRRQLVVRYGGHNQGGGGEQGAEVWTFDLSTARWALKEPNTSPPGVCCNAQNIYDPTSGRYIRFPLFSGSHGWQWQRELYLNDSSVWSYDLAANRWRNMRPVPTPRLAPYRCASWDSDRQVVVVFGGEGSHEGTLIYDPWRNEWRWPKPENEPPSRSGGNMAYDADHKLHVLFGSQFTDDPHTWAYDVATNQWRDMKPETMPPTDKNDAVLTYDRINKVVLAIVKVTTGEVDDARHEVQTWSYEAGVNKWTRMKPAVEPDTAGNRTRNLIFAPELNLAILENCTSRPREQQVWTYRYADARLQHETKLPLRETPPLVEDVVVSVVAKNRVELGWIAQENAKIAGYQVERAAVEVWSDDQLVRLKQNTPPLAQPSVGAIRRIGTFLRLNKEPVRGVSFVDETVDLSAPQSLDGEPTYDRELHAEHLDRSGRAYRWAVFAYRVRTVDSAGRSSGPSPAFFTVPSSPQQVFSREDGTTCRLKWEANPEKGIAGYRVYRLDGRWNKDPVSRLTPDPIADLKFADETAGKSSRRYHIVAVDALGQEGFPSSPVWFEREWRAFYAPFVGEWHQ